MALGAATPGVLGTGGLGAPAWPGPEGGTWESTANAAASAASESDADLDARIREQPVCVASKVRSAGELGDTVLYRFRRDGDRVHVGYWVEWSTERPWGAGPLSYAVVPALLTDAFYSHFLFVLPGVRDAMYGPADVEGASVTYERRDDGSLVPVGAVADDERHRRVELGADDVADASGRTLLVTEAWSHQLGARGGAELAARDPGAFRCFQGASLRPLGDEVARTFRLGTDAAPRRARPAFRLESPASLASR
jgi:hypothetical protein